MFTQKLPGGQKEEKHDDDGVDEEMKMTIVAYSAEKEEGWCLLRQKTILDHQKP